jgi:hypothetical protein
MEKSETLVAPPAGGRYGFCREMLLKARSQMSHKYSTRLRRRVLLATLALTVPLTVLGLASTAQATPKGIFSIFSNCPLESIKLLGVPPGAAQCQYAQTTSGEFVIGTSKVPINQTVTLEGGAIPKGETEVEFYLIPGANGQSISKTALNVPGGLAGLINCEEIKGSGLFEILERGTCKAIFENGLTGVTATTEPAANTANPAIFNEFNLANETGTAIELPVRVHLKNPLLGENCFIGSESSPIQLKLTTGKTSPNPPNTSISGKLGTPETLAEKGWSMLHIKENSLVDNSFSVPVAKGCGGFFSFLIDPIVNNKIKLPSANGHNTAILNGALNVATAEAVEASEKF